MKNTEFRFTEDELNYIKSKYPMNVEKAFKFFQTNVHTKFDGNEINMRRAIHAVAIRMITGVYVLQGVNYLSENQ